MDTVIQTARLKATEHIPAVSVPAGRTAAGLPVGLQIMVRRHRDDVALRLARIFEQARPWPRLAPAPQATA